jgi:hypothetical protein
MDTTQQTEQPAVFQPPPWQTRAATRTSVYFTYANTTPRTSSAEACSPVLALHTHLRSHVGWLSVQTAQFVRFDRTQMRSQTRGGYHEECVSTNPCRRHDHHHHAAMSPCTDPSRTSELLIYDTPFRSHAVHMTTRDDCVHKLSSLDDILCRLACSRAQSTAIVVQCRNAIAESFSVPGPEWDVIADNLDAAIELANRLCTSDRTCPPGDCVDATPVDVLFC